MKIIQAVEQLNSLAQDYQLLLQSYTNSDLKHHSFQRPILTFHYYHSLLKQAQNYTRKLPKQNQGRMYQDH